MTTRLTTRLTTRAAAARLTMLVAAVAGVVAGTWSLTHVVAPALLTHYDAAPPLAAVPKRTVDAKGRAADPVNVALVGSDAEVGAALRAAGWVQADTLDRASKLGIARSVLLHRPYPAAPVSPLFLYGRREDVAFEREVGGSARERHHVRLWLARGIALGGRPVWIGDATFDKSAGISHRGLHPTHHIAADVDRERDTLVADLARAGQVAAQAHVTALGVRVDAHNAEGDRFETDGEMAVVTIPPGNAAVHPTPPRAADPPLVRLKDWLWARTHRGA